VILALITQKLCARAFIIPGPGTCQADSVWGHFGLSHFSLGTCRSLWNLAEILHVNIL